MRMKPIETSTTNCILKGTSPDVVDLPVTRFELSNGVPAVQSCWELSEEELKEVVKNGRVYFAIYGTTHPPICMSTQPIIEEGDS